MAYDAGTILAWKPNKWIATALGLFLGPLGLQYAGAPRRAALVVVGLLTVGMMLFFVGGFSAKAAQPVQYGLAIATAIWAYRIAMAAEPVVQRHWSTRWFGLLATFAVFAAVAVLLRSFLYEPFRAVSGSMEPTVPQGASVIVQKWGYGHPSTFGMTFGSSAHTAELKRGDIIAFDYPRNPAQTYLMRIVGLPGDTISYAGKRLTINGATVTGKQLPDVFDEESVMYLNRFEERTGEAAYSIVVRAEMPARVPDIGGFEHKGQCMFDEDKFECRIPAGKYFVLGDSRDNSYDSRMWGFVASHMVVGKVVKIIP